MKKLLIFAAVLLLCINTSVHAFDDISESLSAEEKDNIRTVIAACADIADFDIKNYDYDSLFKYILYTHENFRILTDIDPMSSSSSSLGYNRVLLVSSSFIDYVMENVFNITPEKPPVNNLTTRGFCYNDGYYLYTGGFNVYFSTEITDIDHIYYLDDTTLLVSFRDIYTEGNTRTHEYSYAILRRGEGGFIILRLGMGGGTPSEEYALTYTRAQEMQSPVPMSGSERNRLLFPVMVAVSIIAATGVIVSVIFYIKAKK